MLAPYQAIDGTFVIPSSQAAPGHGVLPVNAYVLPGRAPVLVDTGLPADRDDVLAALRSLVDPEDLAVVFLTHEDADHAGNLHAVLEAAPHARLVTNYVTLGKLREGTTVPLDRVQVVNAGQAVPGTDRELVALRPPVYDAPGTLGLLDAGTGAMFTVDAFGTYLPELVEDLADVPEADAMAGFADFNRANHPWASLVDRTRFQGILAAVADVGPSVLLSSHGAVPRGRTRELLDAMAAIPAMEPFVPPDQAAFQALRPQMG